MRVGVLALQGDFIEHQTMLERLGVEVQQVRLPSHLEGLAGLIIPGGESTTIGKLAVDFGLLEPLREFGRERAIWGTCAGAIFLSKDVGRPQPLLQLMDISVQRNAFGRQVDSFETDLDVPELRKVSPDGRPFRAIFIRAPLIESVQGEAYALASLP
ncbi:pyridoxal 5'-phosphate synthase glutaminase subunit PdxT, partial [uncultured Anaerolinea sp.]|uniref:pyridoxal 5'-phosphate synthase glutaminase subunit PdxT n=1 Tax=uncultured Anaerolinea sp. TaxID=430695 RepID=UPI0026289427